MTDQIRKLKSFWPTFETFVIKSKLSAWSEMYLNGFISVIMSTGQFKARNMFKFEGSAELAILQS